MKLDRVLKIALITLLIILISIISFVGIYVQDKKEMKSFLKDYKLGMDLKGERIVSITVDNSTKTIYYDKDGNVVESEDEKGTKEEVPVNSSEILTKENYIKAKEIIENRLNDLKVSEYLIRQDENTGKIVVQIPEDDKTDLAVQYIYTVGEFTLVDENENVLLDNSNVKSVKVAYNTTEKGTTVFLNIEFKKDSVEKLKDITNNHLKTTDEEGKDTSKKVTLKLDNSDLISTSFDEEINNGIISLSIGSASTNSEQLNSYLTEASNLAILINNGKLPITYTTQNGQNRYVESDITTRNFVVIGLVSVVVVLIACIIFSIIYKKNGLLISIANIGYMAVLLIIIRYTNVILTTEGLFGLLISVVLNYIFGIYLIKTIKETEKEDIKSAYNKTMFDMILILIPALVVGVTLCFSSWMPIYSFGQIMFWGILMIFIYNTVLTRTLLICSTKK